jgi:hypothetical protein
MASAFTVLQPVVSFEPPMLGPLTSVPASGDGGTRDFSRNDQTKNPYRVAFGQIYLGKATQKSDIGSGSHVAFGNLVLKTGQGHDIR